MGQRWLEGYSAQIELYLLLDGQRLEVEQVAGGFFVLRDSHAIPPGTKATLVIKIDGREEREEVFLKSGTTDNEQIVHFS
jgi:hypothetical protein